MHDSGKFRWMSLDDALAVVAFAALLGLVPVVLSLEEPHESTPAMADDYAGWLLRHERNSRACRGQQYVAQCCTDARTDLTCIDANLEGSQ